MLLPGFIRMALRRRQARQFYAQFLRPGDLALDIGANVGERSAAMLATGARVVAVEPQQALVAGLNARFRGNRNFTAIHAGIGAEPGRMRLQACTETSECATFSTEFVETFSGHSNLHFQPGEEVEILTLAQVTERFGRAAFCKVDTEGYELEVMRGMSEAPKVLAFEFNRPLIHQTMDCLKELERFGECACNYLEYNRMRLMLRDWVPLSEFRNGFASMVPPALPTGEVLVRFG